MDVTTALGALAELGKRKSFGPPTKLLALTVRPAFIAPPGKTLVWGDWSAIEARVLPWLAGSRGAERVLQVFRDCDADPSLPDIYVREAAGILGKPVEEVTKAERQAPGKIACIAEGQLVHTDRGLIPIERVTTEMRVWDGESFVRHTGSMYQGVREVWEYEGLTATADHIVWDDIGQARPFGVAISRGLKLQHHSAAREYTSGTRYVGRARVYDILNAGPRHRFVVSGVLVHNCLSLGFGGALGALQAMATNYGVFIDDAWGQQIVERWRANNAWASALWRQLQEAFVGAIENPGDVHRAGRVAYVFDPRYLGGSVFCALPCGRLLTYPSVRFGTVKKTLPGGRVEERKAWTYLKGRVRKAVWGGLLAENITQGTAASILRATLREIEADHNTVPFETVLHTHDEIIGEVPEGDEHPAREYLRRRMRMTRPWAEGLPLACEINSNWYYTKAKE